MILPSGVSALDRILNGGLTTSRFTHVFGEAGSGKTTLALQFVSAACRLGIRVAYVNSEATSPLERLGQITGKSFTDVEDMIRLISPKSFEEQGAVIDDLELYAREGTRLVVIDTLTRLYRAALEDKTTNYVAHRELNMQAGILKGLARQKDIVVLVLNQVRGAMKKHKDFEPVAKNILDFWSDYVIVIRKRKKQGERLLERLFPEGDSAKETLYLTQDGLATRPEQQESDET